MEPKMIRHEEAAIILALAVRDYCRDKMSAPGRLPFGDGYWMKFGDFLLAVCKYPMQSQYRIEVWADDSDTLTATTDGFVNWPPARLLYEFMKGRRAKPDEPGLPKRVSDFEELMAFGRKFMAEEIADGKNPKA